MATIRELVAALINADRAGDTQAATALATEISRLLGRVAPATAPKPATVERTVMGQIGEGLRGIPRGAIGLLETAGIGASALLPDEEESYLREIISGAAERAASPFQRKAGYEDSLAGTVGEALGSTVPFVLTGGIPGLAARVATGATLGGASGAGIARTRAEQAGATEEERARATALGVLPGVVEMVVPGMIAGRLRKAVGPQLATNISSRLKRIAESAGEEGLQEAASEIAQNLIAQGVYDPEQGVFTNTGESFGLGAGVGGLIAALVELGIRDRSAAGAPPPAPTEEEQAPPSIEGGLFGGQELATVFDADIIEEIGLDLGKSTANKLFGLDLADRAQRAEAEAILTSYINNPLVRLNKPEVISRIRPILDSPIFRRKAEDEDFAPIGTIAAPEEEIPLEERIRVRSPADVQPDFIDIDETQQIQDLLDEEELARMQQEEDARLAAQEAARADAERARTIEEIATLDARIEATRAAESEEKRRQILLPIIESGKITDPENMARAFSAELRRQGFANTTPTETELATIERAVGVQQAVTTAETERAAAEAALQARQEAEQRAGVAPLESLIPERRTAAPVGVSPQEQERAEKARRNRERLDTTGRGLEGQLEIPVIPRAKGAPAAQAPAQEAPAADQGPAPQQMAFDFDAALDEAGVPKAAPVRKRVKNKSPAQAKAELTAFAANPVVKPEVAAAVTKLADSIPVEAAAAPTPEAPVETAPVAVEEAAPTPTTPVETAPVAPAAEPAQPTYPDQDIRSAAEELQLDDIPVKGKATQWLGNLRTSDPETYNRVVAQIEGSTLNAVQPKREEAASIPANQRIMKLVEQGATPAQILRAITQDKDLPQALRDMAAQMLRVAPNINVPVISKRFEAPDEVGEYVHPSKGDEAIYLDPRAESVAQTFVHEFIHAATADGIARGVPAGRRLKELFNMYKAATPESDTYGLKNVYEFVAEALTNPKFQAELKSRNGKGAKKSYWDSFVDFVKNILGIQQRGPLEEILDLTKDLAVQQDKVWQAAEQALTDQTPAANVRFLNVQGAQLNSTSKPMKSKPVRETIAKVMGTTAGTATSNAARKVLTWGLPLPALNDYVQSYMSKGDYKPFADAMNRYTETAVKFEGAIREFVDSITVQISRMGDWKVKNPDKYAAMTELYFGGSHARVDLTKQESDYAGNAEKLAAYRKLKKHYDALWPSGQAIYRQMRAIHNRQFKQISQQVFDRVYAETKDKEMATRVRNAFTEQMREKGPLEGYAPMLRPSGKHMLKYADKNGEPAFEIFTNPNDLAARQQQLIEDGVSEKDIKPFLGANLQTFDGVVPSSFLGKLVATLKEGKADEALVESVMTLGVAMSPTNAVMERLASRKEIAGYVRDPFWAFQEGTVGLGRKLINLEYGAKLNKELRDMQATRENVINDPTALAIVEDVEKRAKYAANPSQSWWSNMFTTGTYGWTLGFNVSSAIVDMSSLVLVTGPYLSKTYGLIKTHRAMMAAAKDILGMGTTADVETLVTQGLEGDALKEALDTLGVKNRDMVRRKTIPSMLNINFNDPAQQKKYGYLKPLVDKLREAGHSERYSELSESAEFGESNRLSKWSARMGFMMNASERFKREMGLKTAYDLALSEFGANPTAEQMAEAAQKAMDMSLLLNGGSTAVTGARFQQNDITRIAFMYRRFAALQMYLQTKIAYDATLNDDPDVKNAARKLAAYTMLTSAALVGVKGMPMMGAVASLWALYGALYGEEDEDNSLDNFLRTNLDPIVVEGIPNILFNANVASRMEMTNLLIRDSNLPNDATLADIVMAHFGGPAYGSISRAYRGAQLWADGDIQRGVENMLPASFSNIFKSVRFLSDGAIETLRGDTVTEVNPFGALAQALGFAPADYARAMDFNVADSNAERRIKSRRTSLYEAVYTAYRVGDSAGVAQAMQKIIEFNQRYPEWAITSEGLRQSVRGRDRNTRDMVMGRLPDARVRDATLERAEDWGF